MYLTIVFLCNKIQFYRFQTFTIGIILLFIVYSFSEPCIDTVSVLMKINEVNIDELKPVLSI